MKMRVTIQAAMTLIEVIVCILIISIVIAISYPAFRGARRSAQISESKSNLHQLQIAIEIYRVDNGGGSSSGSIYQMSLPPMDTYKEILQKSKLKPPWAGRWSGVGWYYYLPPDPAKVVTPNMLTNWESHTARCQSSTVFIADYNFNDVEPLDQGPYEPLFGLGVRLDGSIVQQTRPGDILNPRWWGCSISQ